MTPVCICPEEAHAPSGLRLRNPLESLESMTQVVCTDRGRHRELRIRKFQNGRLVSGGDPVAQMNLPSGGSRSGIGLQGIPKNQ